MRGLCYLSAVTNATATLTSPEYRSLLDQCIHCGLCLPACPTYDVFHTEMDGPRGRIALMRAAGDGRADLDGAFRIHIDRCLGCRACETACPSGVQYGTLLETARAAIFEAESTAAPAAAAKRLALEELLPYPSRLRLGARLLQMYQATGLQWLARRFNLVPEPLQPLEALLPQLSTAYPTYDRPAPALGERRGKVAFLHGCVQDAFLSGVNGATIRVLQRNGYEVHFPAGQSCCGAAPLHVGEEGLARTLARRNIDACAPDEYEAILSNAGGCGATLKEYDHLLADDPVYADRARAFAAQVQDVTEFLAGHLHEPPRGAVSLRVTYADSCHLRHAQRVVDQPRALLRAIPGLTLVEMARPDFCCGSAGIYNILQHETAERILDTKMADIAATHADVIATTNTGCHLQYLHGVRKAELNMRVLHVVELLDMAYRNES